MVKVFIIIFFFFSFSFSYASPDTLNFKNVSYFIRTGFHDGFVWAHTPNANYADGALVNGIEIELIRKRNDTLDKHYNKNGFISGYGINYFIVNNLVIKNNFNVFYTLESTMLKFKKAAISLKACAGLNFISNPYDSVYNSSNLSYSSAVNAFLSMGLISNYFLNNGNSIGLKIQFNHFSNGGIKDPNLGVNFITSAISYQFKINEKPKLKLNIKRRLNIIEGNENLQFTAFATYKTSTVNTENFYLLNGFSLSYNKPFGIKKTHSLCVGAEWLEDRAMTELLIYSGAQRLSNQRVGIIVGHEFLFHQFTWGQYLGYYVYKDIPYLNNLYHRHSISYKLNLNWSIGISLLAGNQKAQFTDFRLTYKLFKKSKQTL